MKLGLRLLRPAQQCQQDAELGVAARQADVEIGDVGMIVGQLPPDHQPPANLDLRILRPVLPIQQTAEALVAVRQSATDVGVVGEIVGQLPLDRRPRRNSASASGSRPASPSRSPRSEWMPARASRTPETVGWSSASFRWIAGASRNSASASDGRPVSDSRQAEVVVAVRQAAAELGDGGVVVGQLLPDRQRLAVLGLRLRRPARRDSRLPRLLWTVRQAAAEVGDGGVVVGQLPVDRQRRAVLGLRLRRPARRRTAWSRGCCGRPPGWLRKSVTAGWSSASFW